MDHLNSWFTALTIARAESNHQEIFPKLLPPEETENSSLPALDISLIGDRMVITVGIKFFGYITYSLDSQFNIGSMSSCCKYKAIPSYYWKPTQIQFRAVNKELISIQHFSSNFPLLLDGIVTYVTLYSWIHVLIFF